jgi:threonylcarbamoyladenosine tRNA methylthiotransferase MtaB
MESGRLRPLEIDDSWGGGRPRASKFEDLVSAILEYTSLEKLRISSVEPMDWSESFIRLMAESPRIAKHANVPMQSGSDTVLRRMHRKYRPWHYRHKIQMIRAAMPTAAIGADVMVGFPGESDFEFEETHRMITELPFTYLHVFTFSARPGTPAATMPNQVPVHLARERNRILRELAARTKRAFMQQFVGQKIEAITLNVTSEPAGGTCTEALTDNYLKMKLVGRRDANQWLRADVTNVNEDTLIGIPTGKLATEVEDLSQTAITRKGSQELTCRQTIRIHPAA